MATAGVPVASFCYAHGPRRSMGPRGNLRALGTLTHPGVVSRHLMHNIHCLVVHIALERLRDHVSTALKPCGGWGVAGGRCTKEHKTEISVVGASPSQAAYNRSANAPMLC